MTIFFRLLETDDKGTALHQAIQQLAQKQPNPITFAVEPESFQQVPGATFAYWVSEEIRQLFTEFSPLENEERVIRVGDHPGDGFRYLRLFWEIPLADYTQDWRSYQKGGVYSPFYYDIHLVANWDAVRQTYKGFFGRIGRSNERPSNYQYFFRPGLTYPRRSQKGLNIRVLPEGCIFADKGPAILIHKDDYQKLLALLVIGNSVTFQLLVELQMAFGSYEVGVIQRTPVPDLTPESTTILANLAHRAWSLKRNLDTIVQTSHAFVLPALLQADGSCLSQRAKIWTEKVTVIETELAYIQTQIDELVFDLYGISESDRAGLSNSNPVGESEGSSDNDDEDENAATADLTFLVSELLAYALSVAFGRFDVRLATGDREFPSEPEPFDPLPVCSPGMLVGENGLPPTAPDEVPTGYPIQIPFDGILVDDEGHPNDIINRVRGVLDVIWGDERAEGRRQKAENGSALPTAHCPLPTSSDIEQEACEILKVSSLRDYFRKPAAFFNDHLTRYSKSRRQAPIYLPLSTASGSYTLWLYYHRLTDQTLYTCINDYVEPKLARVKAQIEGIRRTVSSGQGAVDSDQKKTPTTDHRSLTTNLENLQTLEDELTKFRDELLRVAKLPWKPNLNDGVQITVAPLHSLFRLSKWQKKLKETWDKLEKGDYDWAHLAHSIWTTRVREKCRTDKSLAIAHDLEDLYEPPPETPKRSKRKSRQ